ncbi:hypothetical protein BDQ94DRAFT_173390 [Aspergillus welwitschiae]|uniref:Uncharacterized protein n=1 Tax=Aspergillus welwitschiae TaxID=1341132 RepID=A0A3F3PST3_9EURO|nr:hypothetical protein BDQ94DRAFT_173390 [Aspergillus welwitschiae]RDH29898.1 hypothetical protein BDQ94DRAFT_173390 [Aspergillus welwitschiae]
MSSSLVPNAHLPLGPTMDLETDPTAGQESYCRERARIKHWKQGLRWWFPSGERFFITEENDVDTYNIPINMLRVSHCDSPMTFDIILGYTDIEERNPHVQFLANRVRPPVKPMVDPRDAKVYHPCGATVIEDLVAIYERIGDNPLSFKEADRFPQRVSKVAGEDSPLADILREIKISFEKTAVRDGYADPETPSSSSSESDEWPIALGYDGCGDDVPIRANIGAHRSSRRVIEREYSPATAAYLVDASSDDSFNTRSFRVEDQTRD